MKRIECLAMVLAAVVLGCSSGSARSGTPPIDAGGINPGKGGTGGSSQSASGSGGTHKQGGEQGARVPQALEVEAGWAVQPGWLARPEQPAARLG